MPQATPRQLGRYTIHGTLGFGGMATVYLGRQSGAVGFSRAIAIKRLKPELASIDEFREMFIDECRLAARLRHPNIVPILDVGSEAGELYMVMDFVVGVSLAHLSSAVRKRGEVIPPRIAVAIAADVLAGLQAAHDAKGPTGQALHIVHRDVSPQNVLIGADGMARVIDFGIARAAERIHTTRSGLVKGKLRYVAPEVYADGPVTHLVDVYAVAMLLWESLTGRRLFGAGSEAATIARVLNSPVPPPSRWASGVPPALDLVVLRGLSRSIRERYDSARAMAAALRDALAPCAAAEVSDWMRAVASETLEKLTAAMQRIEHADEPPPAARGPMPSAPTRRVDATPKTPDGAPLLPPLSEERPRAAVTETFVSADPFGAPLIPTPYEQLDVVGEAHDGEAATGSPIAKGLPLAAPTRDARRAGRWRLWGAAALLVPAAIAVAVLLGQRDDTPASGTEPSPAVSTQEVAETATPASATTPSSATATASAVASAVVGAAEAPSASSAKPPIAAPRAPSMPASCRPPYYVDGEGVRRVKRHCMQYLR